MGAKIVFFTMGEDYRLRIPEIRTLVSTFGPEVETERKSEGKSIDEDCMICTAQRCRYGDGIKKASD
jgi:hypothetical protein